MEGGTRVSETVGGGGTNHPSYWLDACEDIACDIIDNFVDFDTSIGQGSVDNTENQDNSISNDFFGGIDRILDSIKNGSGLPSNTHIGVTENGIQDSSINEDCVQCPVSQPDNGGEKPTLEKNGDVVNCDNGKTNLGIGKGENRFVDRGSEVNGHEVPRDRDFDGEERCSKRARVISCRNERQYLNRGKYRDRERDRDRDRERYSGRRRQRDWDDTDRKDRDHHIRRREHYNGRRDGRDRDWRDREPKGYWERDHSGSNELVFRVGSWEADHRREAKEENGVDKNRGDEKVENKMEAKEKFPEEQARTYQLDVLEQAKKKNTIAFLETGAGKTLIAVLLMRSLCNELQKQNKKMLAVFLVPKVPLVYQVTVSFT